MAWVNVFPCVLTDRSDPSEVLSFSVCDFGLSSAGWEWENTGTALGSNPRGSKHVRKHFCSCHFHKTFIRYVAEIMEQEIAPSLPRREK